MIMIVLTVLKWIGIVLLVLLLLILFLLLLILFVPVRYELFFRREEAREEEKTRPYLLKAEGGWLFRLLRFHFHLNNEGSHYQARAAFWTIASDEEEGQEEAG